MIEDSATFSAVEGSLRTLLNFLFSLKQCVPTPAVSLNALVYELVHELAVSYLCTVRVAYMVYHCICTYVLWCHLTPSVLSITTSIFGQ